MIVVRIAVTAKTKRGRWTGPAANNKSTGSPIVEEGGTNPIPKAAQPISNPSGKIDPRIIARRMGLTRYLSSWQTVGKISPYTKSCKKVGMAPGKLAQELVAVNPDQSAAGAPVLNRLAAMITNTMVNAELTYAESFVPWRGPNTIDATDRATVAHPQRYFEKSAPALDIWLTSVASVSSTRSRTMMVSPTVPNALLAAAAMPGRVSLPSFPLRLDEKSRVFCMHSTTTKDSTRKKAHTPTRAVAEGVNPLGDTTVGSAKKPPPTVVPDINNAAFNMAVIDMEFVSSDVSPTSDSVSWDRGNGLWRFSRLCFFHLTGEGDPEYKGAK